MYDKWSWERLEDPDTTYEMLVIEAAKMVEELEEKELLEYQIDPAPKP